MIARRGRKKCDPGTGLMGQKGQRSTLCFAWQAPMKLQPTPLSVPPRLGSQRPLCNISTSQVASAFLDHFWIIFGSSSTWFNLVFVGLRCSPALQLEALTVPLKLAKSHIHAAILSQAFIVETIDLQDSNLRFFSTMHRIHCREVCIRRPEVNVHLGN